MGELRYVLSAYVLMKSLPSVFSYYSLLLTYLVLKLTSFGLRVMFWSSFGWYFQWSCQQLRALI